MSLDKVSKAHAPHYFVVAIPVDEDENGPKALSEAADIIYEIWDADFRTVESSRNLLQMLKHCEAYEELYRMNLPVEIETGG